MSKLTHCISISDLAQSDILNILKLAKKYEANHSQPHALAHKVVASLFFEPSTRTRLSFESAAKYLGAQIIGFAEGTTSSAAKGETLEDTIKTVASYCDAIVMRHPENGSAKRAAEVSKVPIINAGDGSNEHPTQTLLDLYTIQQTQGKLEGLTIGLAGDLRYGRTVHSLIKALAPFGNKFVLIAPHAIQLPKKYEDIILSSGSSYTTRTDFNDLSELDILYMTRVQQERFASKQDYKAVKDDLLLKRADLTNVKTTFKVLHPLPRVNEMEESIDDHPAAHYFDQVQNGLYVRQALLDTLIAKDRPELVQA